MLRPTHRRSNSLANCRQQHKRRSLTCGKHGAGRDDRVAEFGPRALVFGGSAAAEMWYEVMQEAVEEAASNLAGASIAGGKEDDDGGTTDSKNAEDGLTRAITSELLVEGVEVCALAWVAHLPPIRYDCWSD